MATLRFYFHSAVHATSLVLKVEEILYEYQLNSAEFYGLGRVTPNDSTIRSPDSQKTESPFCESFYLTSIAERV